MRTLDCGCYRSSHHGWAEHTDLERGSRFPAGESGEAGHNGAERCAKKAVFVYVLIPVAATILGGLVAAIRRPGRRAASAIQHIAAGVLFAAVAGELLPDLLHERAPIPTIVGFTVGTVLMLGVKEITRRVGGAETPQSATGRSLLVTVGVDMFVDGLMIGIGFAAGAKAGLLLAVALTLELLFLGLAASAQLSQTGVSPPRAVATVTGLAVLVVLGASVGIFLLGGLQGPALALVLAFGTAALLYLVTEELLVEAHDVPDTPLLAGAFFAGFLALLVIETVAA